MTSGLRAWTQTGHGICLALGAGLLLCERCMDYMNMSPEFTMCSTPRSPQSRAGEVKANQQSPETVLGTPLVKSPAHFERGTFSLPAS